MMVISGLMCDPSLKHLYVSLAVTAPEGDAPKSNDSRRNQTDKQTGP